MEHPEWYSREVALKDILCSAENRPKVVDDAARLVDDEVHGKGGLSGLAIKAGYKTVTVLKPSIIREAVDSLLDRFVEKLEPFHADWVAAGKTPSFEAFLMGKKSQVANALLSVTDEKARNVETGTVRKAYEKLRPQGEKNVIEAMPGFTRMIGKYVV